MNHSGTPTDNLQAESFMKTLRFEEFYQFKYGSIADVKKRLPVFLDEAYNHRRTHSALGYLTAEEFKTQFTASRSI